MTAEVIMPLQEGSEEGAGLHTAVSLASDTPSFSHSEVSSCFWENLMQVNLNLGSRSVRKLAFIGAAK